MESEVLGLRPSYTGHTKLPLPSSSSPPFLPFIPLSHITFRHPGYQDKAFWAQQYPQNNIIFRLPTLDGREPDSNGDGGGGGGGGGGWGVHHGTALRACSIIACNIDGFLSPTHLTTPPAVVPQLPLDSLLTADVYYFYPCLWVESQGQSGLAYPVCPTFQDWRFPHDGVPPEWMDVYDSELVFPRVAKPSQYSAAVALRDVTCRVSGFVDCTETVHLVPKKEDAWFTRNKMGVYNRNPQLKSPLITSDTRNCLRLRIDIRSQFNSGAVTFVPKCGTSRAHFFTETKQYGPLLHNRETEEFRVAAQFVYARFAWAVLRLAQSFGGMKARVWSAERNGWVEKLLEDSTSSRVDTNAPTRLPRKRPRLEDKSSTAGISVDVPVLDSDVFGVEGMDQTPSSTPSSGNARCAHEKEIFKKIVSNPYGNAWERIMWHPDVKRLQKLGDAYLSAREPLHEQEQKRLRAIMDRGGILYDGEAMWEGNNQEDNLMSDDECGGYNDDGDNGDNGFSQGPDEALERGPEL